MVGALRRGRGAGELRFWHEAEPIAYVVAASTPLAAANAGGTLPHRHRGSPHLGTPPGHRLRPDSLQPGKEIA